MKNLDLLIPQSSGKADAWVWATVTQSVPLRVRLDGDEQSLSTTPDCLYANPRVGQRVWVQINGTRVIAFATSGGPLLTQPEPSLHSNSSFESGTNAPGDGYSTFWGTGYTSEFDYTQAIEGVRSYRQTSVNTGDNMLWGGQVFSVPAGSTIALSIFAKANIASPFSFVVLTSGPNDNPDFFSPNTGRVDYTANATTTWARYEKTHVMDAAHTKVRIYYTGAANRTWNWDVCGQGVTFTPPDDTGWLIPVFQNNWVDYGGEYPCRYRRKNGIVYVRGLIRSGTVGTATAFTLPAGFRPGWRSLLNTRTDGASGNALIDLLPTGIVYVLAATSTAWVSVELSFPAGQ